MKAFDQHLNPLSLEQVVRFCGAVGDFNPIHYDEKFARNAGLPGVIAQGPLTYLAALDALIAANGLAAIGGLQARLKAPVEPGIPMEISCNAQGNLSLKAGGNEALTGVVLPPGGAS